MEKFTTLISQAVPLDIDNIDTDQIIPARFLKATDKEGFGDNLFRDWRYNKDGTINTEFPLNNANYSGDILVAGNNFGCGSSREHAAWAIAGYGFKVVVSSFFADIFRGNALNNGLLPIRVTKGFLEELFDVIKENPAVELKVDLENQSLSVLDHNLQASFDIDAYKKTCMLNGYDDIDFLISKKDKIIEYEENRVN